MELEKLDITGLKDIYSVQQVQKEFEKAVNEKWKSNRRGNAIRIS